MAQISGTAQVTRQVSLLGLIELEQGRQLRSIHISMAYIILFWTMHIFAV